MNTHRFSVARNVGGILLLAIACTATGAEIKVLSTTAVQDAAEVLGANFSKTTGHKVQFVFEPSGNMLKRMAAGENGDIIIFPAETIDSMVKDGKAAAADVRPFAKSSLGVAVRKGTPKPDISSPEAYKRALLAANGIVIGDPSRGGTGTLHIFRMFEKMGIAENLKPKLVFKKLGGAPGNSQAMRETEAKFGVGQLSEFAPVTEMDIVGPLPGDLNLVSLFSAAILGGSKEAAAARAFIDFMRTTEAAATLRSLGLEPAFP